MNSMENTVETQNTEQHVESTQQVQATEQPIVETPTVPATTFLDQTAQIEKLKAEIAILRGEIEIANLGSIAKQAAAHNAPLRLGGQEVARTRAIAACGGLAKWHALPTDSRLLALGERPASPEELAEVPKYFGSTSSSAEATILAKQNPAKYARLRVIARESGRL